MRGNLKRQPARRAVKARLAVRLKAGSVIGIAAPASPFDRDTFERGVRVLKEMGFEVVFREHLFAAEGYLAGADALRAAGFNRLLRDVDIDAIMCARGGYGSLRLLPRIDYRAAAARPKAVIGFSDATALLAALQVRCGLVCFHGPVLTTLADASERTRQALWQALAGKTPLVYRWQDGVALKPGRASGRLCGGNLTTLCHLTGTPFAPSCRNGILFLEDRGEAPYRIDRMLTQMKMAGFFNGVKGILLGAFADCGPPEEIRRIVLEVFGAPGLPILSCLEAGHCEPNLTLPLGAMALLDADDRSLSIEKPTAG
jgi:muramoyltetrapeptide carboxypeptidase